MPVGTAATVKGLTQGALEQLGAREVLFPGDLPLLAGDDPAGSAPRF